MELIHLDLKVGNIVSRISHNHDIIFKIISIDGFICRLQGVDVRLCADANIDDLVFIKDIINNENDDEIIKRNLSEFEFDRDNYFYIPGNILHIDGDDSYLDRCMRFYNELGIKANGISLNEHLISSKIVSLIEDYRPDIVVITGHDAYYSKKIIYTI